MTPRQKKSLILTAILVLSSFICMFLANGIQSDNGKIRISEGVIRTDAGNVSYKLYKPVSATRDNKAPGVLLLHGYQNDHETCRAYSIELARRGVVVLAIDEYGHGKTVPGLLERGYVNHKVSVNYGEESEAKGTFKKIGGTNRYKILMNFSNLTFFRDKYSRDDEGNSIKDSAEGGIEGYRWLSELDYVDPTRLAVSGHSMGTWASWSVSAAYSGARNSLGQDITPKATVLQCGELFRNSVYDPSIHFNNVLLLQAKYDEFSYFRDYQNTVSDKLLESDLRKEFLGINKTGEWNTTYGDFSSGSARRIELLYTNHRLTTHDSHGLSVAIDWFTQALGIQSELASSNLKAMGKEWLNLAALLLMLGAMLSCMNFMIEVPFFSRIKQDKPGKEGMLRGKKWFSSALISILVAGILYPFATQLGHALVPLPESIFRMTVGNGLITWYLFIMLFTFIINLIIRRKNKKKNLRKKSLYEKGWTTKEAGNALDVMYIVKSVLLVLLMALFVYLFVALYHLLFKLDLRIIWPMLSTFNLMRLGQFIVYILFFAAYFLMAEQKALVTLRSNGTYQKGVAGFLRTWGRTALVMCGGIVLIVLLEYIPFFANLGPGADLLFGSTFGGPFMSLMILLLPQIVVYSGISSYIYRQTGNIYVSALICAVLACWIVTGGSSFV
ncbi:MAG: hypothetical protein IIY57_03845 [Erysipelotrichaceae bacterium]|nr:hypothetical protein [Erysipelotrichaceae bacterium]